MSLHPEINALYAVMPYRWIDACEILASAKEASEQARPTMVRSELTEMIAKLNVMETDTASILTALQEARRLLEAKQKQLDHQAVDILANLEVSRAVA